MAAKRWVRRYYPEPPDHFQLTPEVEAMWAQYEAYLAGRLPLTHMAYFCLTVLEQPFATPPRPRESKGGKRGKAADHYGIDYGVLAKLGEITSTRGGEQARKAEGRVHDLTADEKR